MYRYQGGKGGGGMNWETEINIYTIDTVCRQLMRTDYTARKTQLGSLWWPKWEGNPKRRDICVCRWLSGKDSSCSAGDVGLIPGLGRFPGVGNGNSLQYYHLENSVDRGVWQAIVHGFTKSRRGLSNWACTHVPDSLYRTQKLTQQCKATIPQINK